MLDLGLFELSNASIPNGSSVMNPNGSLALGPNGSHLQPLAVNALQPLAVNATGSALGMNVSTLHAITEASPFMLHSVFFLAIVANCFLYISPLSSALRAFKEQVELKSLASWLAPTYLIFAQSYLWACYAYSTGLTDLARFNAFGAFVCMSYLSLIARCARPREVAQPLIFSSIAAMVFFSAFISLICSYESCSLVFGYSALLFNLGMVLAPLPDTARVLQTGELEEYPVAITVACFFSSLFWTQYAILVNDHLYLVPNLIGTVVSAAQLLVIHRMVWGAGGSGGAQSLLLDVGSQPLMPRVRGGKPGMTGCGDIVSLLNFLPKSFATKSQSGACGGLVKEDCEFGLDDVKARMWGQAPFGTFGGASPMPAGHGFMKKSPFSAFDIPEGLASFADGREEPEFEPQGNLDANTRANEFAFIDGETYRPFSGTLPGSSFVGSRGMGNGAIDCIL